jgi:hypothetical protein
MTRAPRLIPALARFSGGAARQDAWGRLVSLTAGGAEFSTLAPLAPGEALSLRFELGGEDCALSARVARVERDDDGYSLAELRWADMVQRRKFAKVLADVLSRAQ